MYDEYAAAAEQVRPFVADTGRLLNDILADGGQRDVRRRAGHHARHRSRHLSVRHLLVGNRRRRGHRHRRRADRHRHRHRRHQGLRHPRRRRPVPHRDSRAPSANSSAPAASEYGAVTGRPRRCGWLDIPLLRYSNQVNGAEWLVVTKLDVLDELAEIPICVGYEIDGKVTDEIPADVQGLEQIKPVYTTLKGWRTSTDGITDFDKLPQAAKDYLRFQEKRKRRDASAWSPPAPTATRPWCCPSLPLRSTSCTGKLGDNANRLQPSVGCSKSSRGRAFVVRPAQTTCTLRLPVG